MAIALVLFWVAPAQAALSVEDASKALLILSIDQHRLSTPEGRAELVKAVNDYCIAIKDVYPTNSPQEKLWLDGELRGGEDRAMKALASPEFGRQKAKLFTDGCSIATASMSNTPIPTRTFVALAFEFVRFSEDAEYHARRNSLKLGATDGLLRTAAESLLIAALLADQ
jgi:hypothetical protein